MRSPISSQFLAAAATVLSASQALAASTPRSSDADDTPLPVIIWHGLGDSFNGEGIQRVGALAEAIHPGTFVYSISLAGEDSSGDRSATFFGNVTQQLDTVCALLAAHPILSTAPAVDAIGFSQGHNGIVEFKACGTSDWLCKGAMALLRFNTWSSFVQNRLVPAQYYRDPASPAYDTYLDASNFLADINNERLLKNETYKKNIASLENLVMYMFEDDTTVIPRRTAWFDEVNGTDVTPLRERRMYKEDWLGLRELDSKGGIHFRSITGEHMQIPDQVLNDTMVEFFGPVKSKAKGIFESDEL
ncbi:hypothetical protein ACCO45_011913 [Purpureocillium lilacinum]|uniref:Uncharacterized protein n=1 Tax=Purpureocillium lilacinum TaxID=33203 RepID=A0ACC4DDP8_PURLI